MIVSQRSEVEEIYLWIMIRLRISIRTWLHRVRDARIVHFPIDIQASCYFAMCHGSPIIGMQMQIHQHLLYDGIDSRRERTYSGCSLWYSGSKGTAWCRCPSKP